MRPKIAFRILALIMTLGLLATACGSDGSVSTASETAASGSRDDSASAASTDETSSTDSGSGDFSIDSAESTSDTASSSASTEAPEYVSPIADFLGVDTGGFDQDAFAEQDREVQRKVQACMAEQGFEYVPVDYSSQAISYGPGGDLEWGSEAFVQEYGFGRSTMIEESMGQMFESDVESSGFEDPNWEIQQAMSPSEADAYNEALYGIYPEFDEYDPDTGEPIDPNTGEVVADDFWNTFESGGCYDAASQEVYNTSPDGIDYEAFYIEFGDQLDQIYENAFDDPRVAKLQAGWSECMAKSDFAFADQEEMWMELETRVSPIEEALYGAASSEPAVGVVDEVAVEMTQEEIDAMIAESQPSAPELTPELRAQLDEVSKWEIKLAIADFECSDGLAEEMEAVRIELEQQFLDNNQAALAAFLSASSG